VLLDCCLVCPRGAGGSNSWCESATGCQGVGCMQKHALCVHTTCRCHLWFVAAASGCFNPPPPEPRLLAVHACPVLRLLTKGPVLCRCVCVCVQLDDMALMFVKARKMWSSVLKGEMVGGWHGGGGCRRVTALMAAGSTYIWPCLRQDGAARKRLAARNHQDTLLMI
jgi:hypothetical protein